MDGMGNSVHVLVHEGSPERNQQEGFQEQAWVLWLKFENNLNVDIW